MDRKLRERLVYVIIFTLIFLLSTAYAEPIFDDREFGGRGERRFNRERVFDNIVQELNLTPEQQELIQKQREEHRNKKRLALQKLKTKRLELRQELEKQEIDKKKIDSLVAEIKPLLGKLLDLRVKSILAMKEILTPEQFKKLQRDIRKGRRIGPGRGFRGRKPEGGLFRDRSYEK